MKVGTIVRLSLLVVFLAASCQLIANGAASNVSISIQFQYLDDGGTPLIEMSRNDSVLKATRIVLSDGDEVIVIVAREGLLELLVGKHRITAKKLSVLTELNMTKLEGTSRVSIRRVSQEVRSVLVTSVSWLTNAG